MSKRTNDYLLNICFFVFGLINNNVELIIRVIIFVRFTSILFIMCIFNSIWLRQFWYGLCLFYSWVVIPNVRYTHITNQLSHDTHLDRKYCSTFFSWILSRFETSTSQMSFRWFKLLIHFVRVNFLVSLESWLLRRTSCSRTVIQAFSAIVTCLLDVVFRPCTEGMSLTNLCGI